MKFIPNKIENRLDDELNNQLIYFRKLRNFNCEDYIRAKVFMIKDYFHKNKIDSVVIGLSGGIDSSVVLSILHHSNKETGYPKNIIPVTIPSFDRGVSNQEESVMKSKIVAEYFGLNLLEINIEKIVDELGTKIEVNRNHESSDWARGQLVSYVRTPLMYYLSTLENDISRRAVVVGTINKDEGAYLGYVCKAGDGMVDIQLISDIHKSEVYQLANYFKLPSIIINQIPSGDMFDNRSDESVFGASYDFVELFLLEKENNTKFYEKISKSSFDDWMNFSHNLENLHNYNKHKYIGHSPSIHFDVINYKIDGGWKNSSTVKLIDTPINYNKIVNLKDVKSNLDLNKNELVDVLDKNYLVLLKNSLELNSLTSLLNELNKLDWIRAGYDGYVKTKSENGSSRLTFINEKLAKDLFELIKQKISKYEYRNDLYEFTEVSSLFRVIKYEENDYLIPHYDHTYEYNERKRTLKSVVICLTECEGGEFVVVNDEKNDFIDWKNPSNPRDRLHQEKIGKGDILIFNHEVLHESLKIQKGCKIIIRTDLVYEKKNY